MKKTNNINTEKKDLVTEVVFILDRSGSMQPLTADTVGGFNSMLGKQKENEGKAYVTTVLFSETNEIVHDRMPIADVPEMTTKIYSPMGCTALYDAVGETIKHIESIHKYARSEDVPDKTLFVITTDGVENASRKYSAQDVKKLISRHQEKDKWEFIFLGANIDAAAAAKDIGICEERAVNYKASKKGTAKLFGAVGAAVACSRCSMELGDEWRAELDADNE